MRTLIKKPNQPSRLISPTLTQSTNKQPFHPTNMNGPDLSSNNGLPGSFAHDFTQVPVHSKAPLPLQAKCACAGGCSNCQKHSNKQLQAKAAHGRESGERGAPGIVQNVLNSPGQPLDKSTLAFMESRLGHDFSGVRVHTDSKAIEATQSVNALAFTVGHDIAFTRGTYSPQSESGRELLAHELVHVMQQSNAPSLHRMSLKINEAGDQFEQEADRIAKDLKNSSNGVRRLPEGQIQRAPLSSPHNQTSARPTSEQEIDPRCRKKMKEYVENTWLMELKEKYKGKSCADYNDFKTDVMSKLGETEFQTFQDGDEYYRCCAKYTAGYSRCNRANEPPPSPRDMGRQRSGTVLFDKQILEQYSNGFNVEMSIFLKDGDSLVVGYELALIPPELCQEQPLA